MAPSFAPKFLFSQRRNSKFPGKFSNQDLASRNPQKQRLNIPTGFGVYSYKSKWDQKWGERSGDVYFAAASRERRD
jgi:hypothetical protein